MTHRIQIYNRVDDGLQTLYAEMDVETHGRVVAAQESRCAVFVSVYARLDPNGPLAPRVLRGDLIVRVEPI